MQSGSLEKFIPVSIHLREEVTLSKTGSKRLKVKTLLKKFGYNKRTERNTTVITEVLSTQDIVVNPSIMKLGNDWELTYEDWVLLSSAMNTNSENILNSDTKALPPNWNCDGWFDSLALKNYRTEKEVETKFIIPLLTRLGYTEDDRYDAMPVRAANGSRPTVLEIDFAMFNNEVESLKNQVLLTVEAKRESKLKKPSELVKAKNQAKSYSLWTGCSFSMVTDGKTIVVSELARSHVHNDRELFCCDKEYLKDNFHLLYDLISRERLTTFYVNKLGGIDEIL